MKLQDFKEKCFDCFIGIENGYEGVHIYDNEIGFLKDYKNSGKLDKRKGFITFFNFCPFCGVEINWVKIKKNL